MFSENLWKVLGYFFDHPYAEVYVRELARKLEISPSFLKKLVDVLVREELLVEEFRGRMRILRANVENVSFRYTKVAYTVWKIEKSGLLKFLKKEVPALYCIILYGSAAKGLDSAESDIDLLVIGGKRNDKILKDISLFEGKINRKIQLIWMSWGEWKKVYKENTPFYREVITYGLPLYGELPVVE